MTTTDSVQFDFPMQMDAEHAALFLKQRKLLSRLQENLDGEDWELMEGILNLCDDLADALADAGLPQALSCGQEGS